MGLFKDAEKEGKKLSPVKVGHVRMEQTVGPVSNVGLLSYQREVNHAIHEIKEAVKGLERVEHEKKKELHL
jgi:hypothetical protein